jgi:serine/threonine protein kinase
MSVKFLDGWPIHEELELDATEEPKPIRLLDDTNKFSREQWVDSIKEPRCLAGATNPRTGLDFFCLHVPPLDMRDKAGKKKFQAENTPPIKKEDAQLFTDLLRKIFHYDHTKRITASQVLEHPWMQETGQEPGNPRDVVVDPHDTSVPLQTSFDQTKGCSSATSGSEDGKPIFQSSMEALDLGGLCLKEESSASGREAGVSEEGKTEKEESVSEEEAVEDEEEEHVMGKELQKHSE